MNIFDQPMVCVDIETDGTNYKRGHILEIAAIRIENGQITDEFSTLLNPGIEVPYFITNLTGITTSDLQGAPDFDSIAERLLEIMDGAIFVAHNVRFDFSFIKEEFRRIGLNFAPKMMCTVRLSRALHPEHRSHKLSSLIERHGFSYSSRHRAYDDAHVLFQFLKYANNNFSEDILANAISMQLKLPSIPKHINSEDIKALPTGPGVYIFEDENGDPLYIGKSVNIKRRVMSHFTRDSIEYRELKLSQTVHKISYIETEGELAALILESHLIKTKMPVHNRRLRRKRLFVVARAKKNQDGYLEVHYEQLKQITSNDFGEILAVYPTRTKAKAAVLNNVRSFTLCPKLCGLEKGAGACFSYQLHKCKGACKSEEAAELYNARVLEAFAGQTIDEWPFESAVAVSEKNGSKFIVNNWQIMGVVNNQSQSIEPTEGDFDLDAYKILRSFIEHKKERLQIEPLGVDWINQFKFEGITLPD